uniref:DNA helicase n=1 Tax=Tanacetum cinerariifolium TaxID=118510 RepID=A0A6L2JIL6_TANCI|nr:DNA helicase [Tanacetum cinerariifolium]
MRLLRPGLSEDEKKHSKTFMKWLLNVGNDELGEPNEEYNDDSSCINILHEHCVTADEEGMHGDKRNKNVLSDGILKHHETPWVFATRARTKGWITNQATVKCQPVGRFMQQYKNDCKIFNVKGGAFVKGSIGFDYL